MSAGSVGALDTATRRALQPLFNAFDAVDPRAWGDGVVVAVSGGPDSRALLEAFARWPRRPGSLKKAVVVVVDHGQRPGSAAEAAAVVARAEALGITGKAVALDVDALPRSSVAPGPRRDEATLRDARYKALHAVARDEGLAAVVVAHHEGDVVEGLLLHLIGRGGGRGGRSPRVVDERPDDHGPRRIRPFLSLDKQTLRAALTALQITDVVVDEDDLAGRNERAALRRDLLEPLRVARPDVDVALARHARHRREDDDVLDALVPSADNDSDVDAALAPALLRRWLTRRVAVLVDDDPRTSPAAIDAVLRLAAGDDDGDVALRGCTAQIRRSPAGRRVAVVPGAGQSRRR